MSVDHRNPRWELKCHDDEPIGPSGKRDGSDYRISDLGGEFNKLEERIAALELANEKPVPNVRWVETLDERVEALEIATRSTSDDYERRIAELEARLKALEAALTAHFIAQLR